ncbi:hypothetical protein C2845_PM15G03900 [Panicum miliaceum]|uniref:Glycoside hydrolase family 5 domain-containing protein n=1 Tax=Panicum miliaceum TaxID=4540 RepID=A0A3L6QDC3_PANMI|nr:hypothetical protein C2845_PM15G03900 [Panicum miliaceum]
MVILDNHVSRPRWCCSANDGNGFFGDADFDPEVWIDGLVKMAAMFAGVGNVVGMSIRNELRGPRQNTDDWYRYMQRGAEAVHAANPRVLVILSGLNNDNDLSFLHRRPVHLSFSHEVAFEVHWYSFSDPHQWAGGNANRVCARVAASVVRRMLYLLDRGWPVFLSEFGVDNRGRRQPRPFRGPGLAEAPPYKVLFHPATGLCVVRRSLMPAATPLDLALPVQPLELGPCNETEAWEYSGEHRLVLRDTLLRLCLRAEGAGRKWAYTTLN